MQRVSQYLALEQLTEFPNVTNTLPAMTEHSVKKSAPCTFLGLSFGGFTFQAVPNFRTTIHSTHTQCLWHVASSVLTSTLTTSLSHRKHFHSSHHRLHDYKQRGGAQRSLSSDQPPELPKPSTQGVNMQDGPRLTAALGAGNKTNITSLARCTHPEAKAKMRL